MIRLQVQLRRLALVVGVLLFARSLPAQGTFAVSGTGGMFPTSTSGINGVYPHANQTGTPSLPPNFLSTTVTVPANASRITSVVIHTLRHTWTGDAHFILKDPSGVRFNVACPVNIWNSTLYGTSCDYGTSSGGLDYTFVDPSVAALDFPATDVQPCNAGSYLQSGTYHQYFNHGNGAWPNSPPNNCGVLNVALQSISVMPGTWTLECYDWYLSSEHGTFTGWELRGDVISQPTNYCTAGTSTHGCTPSIGASQQPSVAFANPCTVTVSGLEGQKQSLVFYGLDNTGFTPVQWGMGASFLCVKAPTQRTPNQFAGGTVDLCNGSLALDWNAFQTANPTALGNPWMAGEKVYLQGWYRDPPSPKTTNLSDALELTYQP
jgi:hypothetical protein